MSATTATASATKCAIYMITEIFYVILLHLRLFCAVTPKIYQMSYHLQQEKVWKVPFSGEND